MKLVRVRIHEVQMRSAKELSTKITSSSLVPLQLLLGKSKAFRKTLSTIPKNLHMTCCFPSLVPPTSSEKLIGCLDYLF